jgi:chromosome segregation ATPase
MNGRLKYLNLFGVLALAALCIAQWQRDRRLNLELGRLDQVRLQQAAKIDEQAGLLKGLNEDLRQLKTSLANEQSLRSQSEQKMASTESTNQQLVLERNQLKAAITNWANAVMVRDERMKEANARIEQLATELNASIRKYNELATNRTAAVKTSGATRAQP